MTTVVTISAANGARATLTINDDGSRATQCGDDLSGLAAQILAAVNAPKPVRDRAPCCISDPPTRSAHIII